MPPKTGVKYSLKAEVYPRFAIFQKRLASVVPRFQSILDEANLWSCISEGKVKLKDIESRASHVTNQVKVTVVGSDVDLMKSFGQELQVWSHESLKVKQDVVTWAKALREVEQSSRLDPSFMLYLVDKADVQAIQDAARQLSSLRSDQQQNVILYDTETKKNYLYVDLIKSASAGVLPQNDRSSSVSQQIQYLLEDRAVELLEMVLRYTNHFVPKAASEPDKSLLDEMSTQVMDSLRNELVLSDLDPDKAVPQDASPEEMETDSSSPGSSLTSVTAPVDKEAIFEEKLIEFMFKKTKCVLCNHLAKKYGIASAFVNDFLNEGYFGYEMKYRAACSGIKTPKWSEVKTGKQASFLNYRYVNGQVSFFHECETYVKEKLMVLKEMGKLAFELHALLRWTVIPLTIAIPTYPKLPPGLQDALLDLEEVNGCGTMYGRLTLHVSKDLTPAVTHTVREILDQFNYPHSYDVHLVAESVKQAGRSPVRIEVGAQIQATLTDEGYRKLKEENDKKIPPVKTTRDKFGSLGCFVRLAKVSEDASSPAEDHLYCVTCAHCVTDCEPEVKVSIENTARPFGTTAEDMYIDDGERLDIAVIKVNEREVRNCETFICAFNRKWGLYEGKAGDDDLVGQPVLKRGYQTGETTGIVSCNDYKKKWIQAFNEQEKRNFDSVYNILIEVEPGINKAVKIGQPEPGQGDKKVAKFSEKGDSGSVVYQELTSKDGVNNFIRVVSLVQGSMTNQNVYQCTYSCHLKLSIEELCRTHGYRLVEPGATELIYMRQGRDN